VLSRRCSPPRRLPEPLPPALQQLSFSAAVRPGSEVPPAALVGGHLLLGRIHSSAEGKKRLSGLCGQLRESIRGTPVHVRWQGKKLAVPKRVALASLQVLYSRIKSVARELRPIFKQRLVRGLAAHRLVLAALCHAMLPRGSRMLSFVDATEAAVLSRLVHVVCGHMSGAMPELPAPSAASATVLAACPSAPACSSRQAGC
jgi:hypothetical protein